MNRRDLLRFTAAAGLLSAAAPAWAATAPGGPKRLIVIFLRGAVDGLSVVVPHAEADYYAVRPSIAIPRPGDPGGVLPLDQRFGLHPALAALMPLWHDGALAFVHAAGSPDGTRSHFDAQLFIENGTPGRSLTQDGWMNRLLAALPGPHGPADAVSVGPTLPRILAGPMPVANLPLGPQAAQSMPIDKPEVASAFDRLYAGNDRQSEAYRQGRTARAELIGDLPTEERIADNGAPPPQGFPVEAAQLAHMIGQDRRIRLAFASLGGWDTHVNQGNQGGQLANHLKPLGDGLAGLARGLGRDWDDTVVVVLSEFGRTVRENGNGGTDHGHGNVIWLLGGAVKGGRVYGDWPGLAAAQLYEGRDLAVTTDYRAVLAAVLERHLRLGDRQLATVFPGLASGISGMAELLRA
ncbi:MAG: DUF1501 domain-containing protein [Alphaproteobacteria bacterium]|nr:DUF1501 domain-containing protein [Alphaproteobacteria bacterium]